MSISPEQTTLSRREELIAAVEKVGVSEAVRRIKSVAQESTEKPRLTREKCPLCRGTGASNPDAEHSMDWRDYIPCFLCHGTGFVVERTK